MLSSRGASTNSGVDDGDTGEMDGSSCDDVSPTRAGALMWFVDPSGDTWIGDSDSRSLTDCSWV